MQLLTVIVLAMACAFVAAVNPELATPGSISTCTVTVTVPCQFSSSTPSIAAANEPSTVQTTSTITSTYTVLPVAATNSTIFETSTTTFTTVVAESTVLSNVAPEQTNTSDTGSASDAATSTIFPVQTISTSSSMTNSVASVTTASQHLPPPISSYIYPTTLFATPPTTRSYESASFNISAYTETCPIWSYAMPVPASLAYMTLPCSERSGYSTAAPLTTNGVNTAALNINPHSLATASLTNYVHPTVTGISWPLSDVASTTFGTVSNAKHLRARGGPEGHTSSNTSPCTIACGVTSPIPRPPDHAPTAGAAEVHGDDEVARRRTDTLLTLVWVLIFAPIPVTLFLFVVSCSLVGYERSAWAFFGLGDVKGGKNA